MQKGIKSTQQTILDLFESFVSEIVCPITQMPMKNPVVTQDGHSYEQGAIYKWLINSKKSPKTGLKLSNTNLIPNHCLKQVINKLYSFKNDILHQVYNIVFPLMHQIDKNAKKTNTKLTQLKVKFDLLIKSQHLNHHEITVMKEMSNQVFELLVEQQQRNKMDSERLIEQFPLLRQQIKSTQDLSHKSQKPQQKIKPKTNHQLNSSQEQQAQQIFVKWIKSLACSFQNHNQYTQNNLLEPYEYLLQKFNSQAQEIADRYRKDRYSHDLGLWHNSVPIDSMMEFVKYDWNVLQFINLCKCQINDEGWRVFVKHSGSVFSEVKTVWIYGNQIASVNEKDLQGFRKLRQIQFCHYNGLSNPFSSKTKENLKQFKAKQSNKHIYVQFSQ